jgi:hypothetical protein
MTRVVAKTPRNPHDRLFKAIFADPEAALPLLRATLPAAVMDAIDPGSLTPGPTDFVNDELEEDHRDLMFSATIRGRPVIFYIIEHQRTVPPFMPLRLLRYVLKVWDWWLALHPEAITLPAVIPLVLHQGPKAWDGPRSLAELMDLPPELLGVIGAHLPALEVALQDLGASSPENLAGFPGPPLVQIALALMRSVVDRSRDPLVDVDLLRDALRRLLAQPGGDRGLGIVLRYTVLARKDIDRRHIAEALRMVAGWPEGEEVILNAGEYLVDEGALQGMRRLVRLQMTEKFGPVPDDADRRLEAATTFEELETWAKRILSARRIDDVFAPSARRRKKPPRKP